MTDTNQTKHQGLPCPVCRVDLMMSERQGVEIDYCPKCRGVWLDRGELDKIIALSEREPAPAPQGVAPVPGGFLPAQPMAGPWNAAPSGNPQVPPPRQGAYPAPYEDPYGRGCGHGGGHGGHGGGHDGGGFGHGGGILSRLFR